MYTLNECTVCSTQERTIVCEFNRLIFIDEMCNTDLARYDYALCHGCGIVYATRRPERTEYDYLYENFNEFLIKKKGQRSLNQSKLGPAAKEMIDSQFISWQELEKINEGENSIQKRLKHELKTAKSYIPFIVPYLDILGAKLLHIRAKSSTLADYMRVTQGLAAADLITLFPGHKYLAEKNGWVRAESCLDYENFVIPFKEKYNLIIENHILIHMMNAKETFKQFQEHLNDGGFLFLEKELADDRLFIKGKNIFAELRPFHFQQFDLPTIKRVLQWYNFQAVSVGVSDNPKKAELFGAACYKPEQSCFRTIDDKSLRRRLAMYCQWRDESILSLSAELASELYGSELDAIWERVKASGRLQESKPGKIPALRPFAEAKVPQVALEMFRADRGRKIDPPATFRAKIRRGLVTAGLLKPLPENKKRRRSRHISSAAN